MRELLMPLFGYRLHQKLVGQCLHKGEHVCKDVCDPSAAHADAAHCFFLHENAVSAVSGSHTYGDSQGQEQQVAARCKT